MATNHKLIILTAVAVALGAGTASARVFLYYDNVKLKVGQSIILKGVRAGCNGSPAPSFAELNRLPKPKTGVLLDGGKGYVDSNTCKRRVPARGIRFKATKPGTETITIYKDKVRIQVQ